MEEHQIIESLAETIEREIDGIYRTEVTGKFINLFTSFKHNGISLYSYIASVGFCDDKITFTIYGTDIDIGRNIDDPESFDIVFDKVREIIKAYQNCRIDDEEEDLRRF